jgi:SAM-dependent methyltransferase
LNQSTWTSTASDKFARFSRAVAGRWVSRRALRPLYDRQLRRFDRRYAVDTMPDRGHTSAGELLHNDAFPYERLTTKELRQGIRALPIDPREFTFVDLGCGKGGALLVALELGYKSCIGVEFDRSIAAVARRNLEVFATRVGTQSMDYVIVEGDAAAYTLPDTPCVVYLFNPFGLATMKDVLANVGASFAKSPRKIIVAYCNPVYREVFDDCAFLQRTRGTSLRWAVYETVLQ